MERGEKSRAERDRLTAEKMRTTEACKFTEKATKSWRRWKHGCGHLQEGGAVAGMRGCSLPSGPSSTPSVQLQKLWAQFIHAHSKSQHLGLQITNPCKECVPQTTGQSQASFCACFTGQNTLSPYSPGCTGIDLHQSSPRRVKVQSQECWRELQPRPWKLSGGSLIDLP